MHDLESYVLSRKDLLLDENLEIECTIRNLERFHETRIRLSIRASACLEDSLSTRSSATLERSMSNQTKMTYEKKKEKKENP